MSRNGYSLPASVGAIGPRVLMAIRQDPRTGKQVSITGAGYATFWIAIRARLIFTYGANN